MKLLMMFDDETFNAVVPPNELDEQLARWKRQDGLRKMRQQARHDPFRTFDLGRDHGQGLLEGVMAELDFVASQIPEGARIRVK